MRTSQLINGNIREIVFSNCRNVTLNLEAYKLHCIQVPQFSIQEQNIGMMDQTVDILGLCDDTVGYSKTEEIENKPQTILENNLVFEASKQQIGINGFNSKISSEDKKPLVYNANIQRSYFVTLIPQTKVEFFRLFGMTVVGIVSIVLLYLIFDTKSKGIRNYKANYHDLISKDNLEGLILYI